MRKRDAGKTVSYRIWVKWSAPEGRESQGPELHMEILGANETAAWMDELPKMSVAKGQHEHKWILEPTGKQPSGDWLQTQSGQKGLNMGTSWNELETKPSHRVLTTSPSVPEERQGERKWPEAAENKLDAD